MFTKKGFLLFLLAFSFSSLMSFEHLNHIDSQSSNEIHELDCEYSENLKAPKLNLNILSISSFPIEIFYLFNLNIHSTLLDKNYDSRAPPQK